MILYSRTNWYGIGYFFSLRGSVLPRVVPAQVVSCLICFVVHKGYLDDAVGSPVNEWIGDTYAMQLFGVVFGYLCVTRINMSYSRYWEGTTMVKNMHSKWADACGQVLNFDRCASPKCDLTDDPFCCHIVRLFSQLSAMATMRLHVEEPGQAAQFGDLPGVEVSTLQRQQAKRIAQLLAPRTPHLAARAAPIHSGRSAWSLESVAVVAAATAPRAPSPRAPSPPAHAAAAASSSIVTSAPSPPAAFATASAAFAFQAAERVAAGGAPPFLGFAAAVFQAAATAFMASPGERPSVRKL
mmetsp:Transcript_35050/g.96812  ORF Transcript_35050/g.96812 Transcript_35050/m.96812 type:complete len:297 (-) Transcript_35050:951-1841(-)